MHWFYEKDGQRMGPVDEEEVTRLIGLSDISPETLVWTQGLPDWVMVADTDLRMHFEHAGPPSLPGGRVKNTVVWILALAPLVGYFLEWLVAGAVHEGNEFAAHIAMGEKRYWFVTVGLNLFLSVLDERRLRKAGHDTEDFKGWVWLVPVYLYQRAKATRQNLAYFMVWIACFAVVLVS